MTIQDLVGIAAVTTSSRFERKRARYGSQDLEEALGFSVAVISLGAVLTCVQGPPRQSGVSRAEIPGQTSLDASALAGARQEGSRNRIQREGPLLNSLSRFRSALSNLTNKNASEPLRVMWLGDSHTAGIAWPASVESVLLNNVVSGGPGYLPLGLAYGRYHGAHILSDDGFDVAPHPPAKRTLEGDGVFGLGGTRVTSRGRLPGVTIKLDPTLTTGEAICQLLFRYQGPSDRVAVIVSGKKFDVEENTGTTLPHGLRLYTFNMPAQSSLEIRTIAGSPELFGVIVENEAPGLVVDVLGINGARFATPLAWDEESWKSLIRWRHPRLAIIAYGTNEVFDSVAPDRYKADIQLLMDRIRSAIPDIDCMLAGPTDVGRGGHAAEARALAIDQAESQAAEQLGCAYFSPYRVMGGERGFDEWLHATPSLAAPDRIHLSVAGYRKLGRAMGKLIGDEQ